MASPLDFTGTKREELLKLHRAVESSSEAIFITDIEGVIIYINPGFTILYGYSSDEVIGKCTPRILKSGIMKPENYEYFWQTILSKNEVKGELINKTKDGRLLTVEGSANHILNDSGEIIGFIGVQHDITAKKDIEAALKRSEELFRKAFMTSPDAVNINRLSDGMYESVNIGFTKILGYTAEESIGRTSVELNIWDSVEDRNALVNILKEAGSVENFEVIFRHKSGNTVSGLMSASIIDLEGVPHILSITKDISLRKNIEKKYENEQFLVNALMNNLPDHIYFKDKESRFIRNSKSHLESFGLTSPDQLIGKSDFDFFKKEAAEQAFNDEKIIMATGEPIMKEEKLIRKDNTIVWFSAMKLPLSDKNGNIIGTFGISRDISLQKRLELENQINYEITQGITTTSNLDELLKLIHQSLRKVVYADNCFVALHDEASGLFSFPYFVDKFDSVPSPTSMGKSCSSYVFRTARPLLLTQQIFNSLVDQNEVELVGSNSPSWIGVPLQTPSKVIGVLVLQNYEEENVYSEGDVKFLTSIGSQIAFAIERKQAETELFERERDLNESQKIAGLGSYKFNFTTGVWTSSKILDSIFGIDEKYDRSIKGWMDLIHPDWQETMSTYLENEVLKKKNRFDKEYKIIRKNDGKVRWLHGQGELIFDSENKFMYLVGSILDITVRKESEEEIKIKNELLQVVAATQIITEEIQNMNIEEIREITGSMKTSATNIYSLLENLLEWSRLRRGGVDFVPVKLNLKKTI
jgi:PAS domain S-box-containing protein